MFVVKYQSGVGYATAPPGPYSEDHPSEEAEHGSSTADTEVVRRHRNSKRTRSMWEDTKGQDGPADKRPKTTPAAVQRLSDDDSNSGAFHLPPVFTADPTWKTQDSRPVKRTFRSISQPLPLMRSPTTLAFRQARTQRLDQPTSNYRIQIDVNENAGGSGTSELADRLENHTIRLHDTDIGQRDKSGKQQDRQARGTTHEASASAHTETAGGEIARGGEQGQPASESADTNEEARLVSEKVLNERLSTHLQDLQAQIKSTLRSVEEDLTDNITRAMAVGLRTGTMGPASPPVLKPGSKLPNGVVVWDV